MRVLIVKKLVGGLVVLDTFYGKQIWDRVKMRKEHRCASCKETIEKGSQAYRPLTNGYNRMDRLCTACIEQAQ